MKRVLEARLDLTGRTIALMSGAVCLLALAMVATGLWAAREQRFDRGAVEVSALAQVTQEMVARAVQVVDVTLLGLGEDVQNAFAQGSSADEAMHRLLVARTASMPYVRAIWVLDASGLIRYDSDVGNLGIDLSDRDYFQAHRESVVPGIFIGKAVRSRTTGTWFVSVSHAVRGSSGRLEGVVVAALEPHVFAQLWRGVDVGAQGAISVFSKDGILLVRSPQVDGALGRSFAADALFAPLPSAQLAVRQTSSIDGVERLYARRQLADYPSLVLVAEKSVDELLEPWVRFSVLAIGGWFLGASLLALLAALLARELRLRQQTQLALRDSEERRHFALEAAAIGDWSMDLESNQAERSLRHDQCFGYTEPVAHWSHETFLAHVHPDDRERVGIAYTTAMAGDGLYDVEFKAPWPDGTIHWLWSKGRFLFDTAGRPFRFAGVLTDVTARRTSVETLRQSLWRYDQLFRHSHDAILQTRTDGAILAANPAACVLFGMSQEALRAGGRAALVDTGDPRLRQLLASRRESGEVKGELTMRRAGGQRFEAEISSVVYQDDAGEQMTSMIVRDITERKAVEEALRESEERFRLLALSSNDTIWDWDIGRDTVWWNEGSEIMTVGPREVDGLGAKAWTDRLHPQDRDRVIAGIRQAVRGRGARWSDSYRFRRTDGSYADISDRGSVIRDAAGMAVRMIGSMTDVTGRLALEAQLRQSQKLESVGQLTGGVAHDFNNLLTVILGNAELLSEQLAGNARLAPLADMAVEAAQRGAELTQRLLAFARRQALDPKAFDVNQLVTGMDAMLRRTLGEHIEIRFAPGTGLWPALVDPAQLDSALLNLCLNARDAMAGGGRLTIETANTHLSEDEAQQRDDVQPGEYVMLAVSDTGTGIAREHLSRVFEPFFTTKETGKGTGLGLSMIYGFVRQSGGYVNVWSEPGQGTTVRLYLPRALQAAALPQPTVRDAQTVGGMERVLLVEDDELVRRYAYDQLVALGYQVRQAHDGAQGLEMLASDIEIDLLFTDVVMPGMSGRQLADQARALRPALKVLYASGYAENEIVHHGRLDSGAQLLAKPYRRDELARRIREILDQPG